MQKRFENFTISVLKLYRLVQKIKAYEMREFGLKSIHVMCVYYLAESRDGLTEGELVRLTFEDKAAISRAVKSLEEKGYVVHNPNKYNSAVRLTPEGNKLAGYIAVKAENAVNAGNAKLTDEESNLFYTSLAQIAENLKTYYGELVNGND